MTDLNFALAGETREIDLTFKLSLTPKGALKLSGVDKKGVSWAILTITPDGTLYRNKFIAGHSGLQLDDEGRIVETYS